MPPATTESYTLSLHDALPISAAALSAASSARRSCPSQRFACQPKAENFASRSPRSAVSATQVSDCILLWSTIAVRSEEHTSELQSRQYLVCRLLLEKKKKICSMTFPILASLLVRLVFLLTFQLLRLSLATPSRWTSVSFSVLLLYY